MEHLPTVIVEVIKHRYQRYDTAGDYREPQEGLWLVTLSRLPDWRMEACLFIHEFVEMVLTRYRGVPWEEIDRFDMAHPELDDPGACQLAPYHIDHVEAETIERRLCFLLGIGWEEYQAALAALEYHTQKGRGNADSRTAAV